MGRNGSGKIKTSSKGGKLEIIILKTNTEMQIPILYLRIAASGFNFY